MVQLYITFPSTITVQAPHVPRSQTRFDARADRADCAACRSSVVRGSRFTLYGLPLMVRVNGTAPGPSTAGSAASTGSSLTRMPVVRAPPVTPTLVRKPRRENPDRFSSLLLGGFFSLTERALPLVVRENKTNIAPQGLAEIDTMAVAIRTLARAYAYAFQILVSLVAIGLAWDGFSGEYLRLPMFYAEGSRLNWWLVVCGIVGLTTVLLALTRAARWPLSVWSLIVAVQIFRGWFLSSYYFSSPSGFWWAAGFVAVALLAFAGSAVPSIQPRRILR